MQQSSHPPLSQQAAAFEAHLRAGESTVGAALRADIRLLTDLAEVVPGPPASHGKEHDVWLVSGPDGQRVVKLCRLSSRPYGVVAESPSAYLWRWSRTNLVFQDDVRVEGILPNGRFVISQPFIAGEHPDRTTLHRWLNGRGWIMFQNTGNIWRSPDGRLIMTEAHEGNFLLDEAGEIHPIDVALHSITCPKLLSNCSMNWEET
jgi:hypothetical protein